MTRFTHSAGDVLEVTPAKEWTVVPPMAQAATPVVAVTTIFLRELVMEIPLSLAFNTVCSMCDFPDPAGPVKNTE